MNIRIVWSATAAAWAVALCAHLAGLTRLAEAQSDSASEWAQRTPWGDPNLQGEWTTEGEFGVPFERPAEFGTREFLTDEEYAQRLADVQQRDERDLESVDVLSGKVDGPNAPIPHWRGGGEYRRSIGWRPAGMGTPHRVARVAVRVAARKNSR